MGKLISFFIAGPTAPARMYALLIAAAAVVIACMSLLIWGMYWRGEYRQALANIKVLEAQVQVSSAALASCNAGVDQAKRVGDAAIASMAPMVEAARRLHAGSTAAAASLEDLARQARGAGEDCGWAWRRIQEEHKKARAAP
jgi:hypothetical protein